MKKVVVATIVCVISILTAGKLSAQPKENVLRYIEKYRNLAMSEQQRVGIPAAIKLAQGIHETAAGGSELAVNANNHFGIKCKSEWKGETYSYTDDRPNECFRKYNMDFESYQDHSNYLKGSPRYASLFQLSMTDYAGWAMGLRKAGYATNPNYAKLLINLIETYHLQEYTYAAMGGNSAMDTYVDNADPGVQTAPVTKPVQQPARQEPAATPAYSSRTTSSYSYNTTSAPANNTGTVATNPRYRGGNASAPAATIPTSQPVATPVAQPVATPVASTPAAVMPDMNTAPAADNTVKTKPRKKAVAEPLVGRDPTPEQASTVVKINNLKAVYAKKGDMPLQYAVRNGIRYQKFLELNDLTERPLPADMPLYLERKHFWGIRPMHLVKYGETMLVIAQKEGIQLKYLRELNYMEENEEPVPGVTLELQASAMQKPNVTIVEPEEYEPVAQTEEPQQQSAVVNNPRYGGNTKPVAQPQAQPVQQAAPSPADMRARQIAQQSAANQRTTVDVGNTTSNRYVETIPANTNPRYVEQPAQPVAQTPAVPQKSERELRREAKEAEKRAEAEAKAARIAAQAKPAPAPQPVYQQPIQQPVSQQQYVETQPRAQQPVQYTTPNPAEPQKSARELRAEAKQAKRDAELAAAAPKPQPVAAKPKTELDLLKEQFDNVIYTDNLPAQTNTRQQPAQRQQPVAQTQTAYRQQPVQQQPVQQTAPAADPAKTYTVKKGDTAYSIAKKNGISIRQLMDWNGLDFDAIQEGQSLKVKP